MRDPQAGSYFGTFNVKRSLSGRQRWEDGDTRQDKISDVSHLIESGALCPADDDTAAAVSIYFDQEVGVDESPSSVAPLRPITPIEDPAAKAKADQAAQDAAAKAKADQAAQDAADKVKADQAAQDAADKAKADQAAQDAADKAKADQAAQDAADKAKADQADTLPAATMNQLKDELLAIAENENVDIASDDSKADIVRKIGEARKVEKPVANKAESTAGLKTKSEG